MDLLLSTEDIDFREEVRMFLRTELPRSITTRTRLGFHASKPELKIWNQILNKKGWAAPNWPVDCGGTGWSHLCQYLFLDECSAADAPATSVYGLRLVGPVICAFGTDEQKRQHLPPILSGSVFWCQGYSEPGAGSDLASLATRAVRDGDDYVVNGHKIWTSDAHMADWIFCLVRTDGEARQQSGISFLLIDMRTPGISIRPIISIDGQHSLNEVVFDDVRVPISQRIGEENGGWTCAKFLLSNERTGIAEAQLTKQKIRQLRAYAAVEHRGHTALIDMPEFRRRLARIEIDFAALEWTLMGILCGNGSDLMLAASALKLQGTALQQQVADLGMEVVGLQGIEFFAPPSETIEGDPETWAADAGLSHVPDHIPGWATHYFYRRAASIYGGTSEVQKNILSKLMQVM